jgi:uncharacterized RDD family membrane protein YckC
MTEIRISTNNFQYASVLKRLGALAIDMLIVNLLVLAFVPGAMAILNALGDVQVLGQFLLGPVGMWFLIMPVLYMFLLWGLLSKSIGMIVMKTRIATESGAKIGWLKAAIRVFGYIISGLLLMLGFLPILFDKKRRGLHDRLAGTVVILKR